MSYKLPVAVFHNGYIYTNVIPCKIVGNNGKKWAHIEKLEGETKVVAEFTGELDIDDIEKSIAYLQAYYNKLV